MSANQDRLALADFDRLPDAAYVTVGVVAALYGTTVVTIWRRVREGKIPQPRKFGPQTTRWNVGELRRDLAPCAAVA